MDLEYSFSLNSSRSMWELSMSAERWGMLETQATVRSEAGRMGFSVEGVCEVWRVRGGMRSAHVGVSAHSPLPNGNVPKKTPLAFWGGGHTRK